MIRIAKRRQRKRPNASPRRTNRLLYSDDEHPGGDRIDQGFGIVVLQVQSPVPILGCVSCKPASYCLYAYTLYFFCPPVLNKTRPARATE